MSDEDFRAVVYWKLWLEMPWLDEVALEEITEAIVSEDYQILFRYVRSLPNPGSAAIVRTLIWRLRFR